NQSEYLADGIAERLGVEVDRGSVVRRRYNRTQTSRSHLQRWDNVKGIFAVRNAERLRGRHILLVDDVFTTGATIMSLGETILQAVPDARLSVATLAATHRSLNRKE
ncbi:MAG: ComF family protein, partial [Alistipes sp.]|nr:ComF family protein [Alistipes sp.]